MGGIHVTNFPTCAPLLAENQKNDTMRSQCFTIAFFILSINYSFGQRLITAKIVDWNSNAPIDKALIFVEGDSVQTISNHLGYFQLTVLDSDFLIIEHDAYERSKLLVPAQNNFLIKIKPSTIRDTIIVANENEKGKITDGQKIGTWEYYDKFGQLSLKYDYDTGESLFIQPDSTESIIELGGKFVKMKVDQPARFLGSLKELNTFVGKNVRYPNAARRYSTVGTLYVQFVVDSLGKATNFSLINDIGNGCGEEVIRVIKLRSNSWIAASTGDETFNSRFIMPVKFNIVLNGKEIKHRKLKRNMVLPLSQHLMEVTITAIGVTREKKYLGPVRNLKGN